MQASLYWVEKFEPIRIVVRIPVAIEVGRKHRCWLAGAREQRSGSIRSSPTRLGCASCCCCGYNSLAENWLTRGQGLTSPSRRSLRPPPLLLEMVLSNH